MARKKRARAREIALQALYQYDLASRDDAPTGVPKELQTFIERSSRDEEVTGYARELLEGTLSSLRSLDSHIASAVAHWKFERIAPLDRSVLRLALYEIIEVADVPPKVSINEAIELAKKYSTARSGAFVNGVLDRIYRDLHEERGAEQGTPVDGGPTTSSQARDDPPC